MIQPSERSTAAVRRKLLRLALGALALPAFGRLSYAQSAGKSFPGWAETFRARARARGVSDATYTRVMTSIKPDTSVYALKRNQPEFREPLWKYLNRRVSEWRITTGRERANTHAALVERIEKDYGVDRFIILALWGMESAFGEVIANRQYMRPVLPALAALAWGEPTRRRYWEQELLNALLIVERGWASPEEMIGSWAGAMGHTQWMPEVWLAIGVDYDRDGRVFPFGPPDDALAGAARYLAERGKFRRGEMWGCEVLLPKGFNTALADRKTSRTVGAWRKLGVSAASDQAFPPDGMTARLWVPVRGGPAFLIGQNFLALRSYNPSDNYSLALALLGDRIRGGNALVREFPGGERALTTAEIQEIQRRLAELGYDTGRTDGRISGKTLLAVQAFQRKAGLAPADGYPGLTVLARLQQGL